MRYPLRNRLLDLKSLRVWVGVDAIYFLQGEIGGPIKIGTTRKLPSRLDAIQSCCPIPLRLLGVIIGGRDMEQRLHELFSPLRIHGEWFADHDGQIFDFIANPFGPPRAHSVPELAPLTIREVDLLEYDFTPPRRS